MLDYQAVIDEAVVAHLDHHRISDLEAKTIAGHLLTNVPVCRAFFEDGVVQDNLPHEIRRIISHYGQDEPQRDALEALLTYVYDWKPRARVPGWKGITL